MELGLSLGDTSRPLGFLAKDRDRVNSTTTTTTTTTISNSGLGFCMALGINSISNGRQVLEKEKASAGDGDGDESEPAVKTSRRNGPGPPLPLVPRSTPQQPGLSWPSDNAGTWGQIQMGWRGFDVNRVPPPEEEEAAVSSPNPSAGSSLQMDLCIYSGGGGVGGVNNVGGNKTHSEAAERASSRASDEEENDNGLARKKLRLSREQSAYLEENFKEQNTLNHKQKLALAKQLNLLPRQVEVWFQNRRARTKLKQTEVDCEYLKRCCETLTEENRRLQKELHELRALKTSTPFYMQLPPTTLTMCPSCERIATITSSSTTTAPTTTPLKATPYVIDQLSKATPFPLSKPRFYPLSQPQSHQSSAAS